MKGNRPALRAAVRAESDRLRDAGFAGVPHDGHGQVEAGHGRVEGRYATVAYDPRGLPPEWPDVAAVVEVGRGREAKGVRTDSAHYDVTSRRGTAAELANLIRRHWSVESTQSDNPRSDNLSAVGRAGYDLPGGPARARRMVSAARGPRRSFLRSDSPARVPPPRPPAAVWGRLPPDRRRRLQRLPAGLLARPLTAAAAPPREGRRDHPRA